MERENGMQCCTQQKMQARFLNLLRGEAPEKEDGHPISGVQQTLAASVQLPAP